MWPSIVASWFIIGPLCYVAGAGLGRDPHSNLPPASVRRRDKKRRLEFSESLLNRRRQ